MGLLFERRLILIMREERERRRNDGNMSNGVEGLAKTAS